MARGQPGVLPPKPTRDGAYDEELREFVELAFEKARPGGPPQSRISRRQFPGVTSYAVEILTVERANGASVKLFLKDFGASRLPKEAAGDRRRRELRVYRDLLAGQQLGTARFYGARWDERAGRFWLLLEFVEGELVRDCGFEAWTDAAAWLGRLHGRFHGQRDRLGECGFLALHDGGFFLDAAERARTAVTGVSEALARRLTGVLKRYEAIVPVLSLAPDTLVHGSYRPQNIIRLRSPAGVRVCPADWELAALGHSTHDLAYICDGFRPPRLDTLLDAYEREAQDAGVPARDRAELRYELDCFRLYTNVNSLGHAARWPRPRETALKVLDAAEELAGAVT